ncbi:MAG: aspartate kinase [Chloroflexota bacterium]
MRVMKFGAASVNRASRLHDLVRLIQAEIDTPQVVVCTTIPSITDSLIDAARRAASGDETLGDTARRDLWSRHRSLAEKVVQDDWEREALYQEWATILKMFDRLIRSIATLRDLSPRGVDAVAALGEHFITHLIAVVLRQGGVAAQVIDATELIVTDNNFGVAQPLIDETAARVQTRLQPLLKRRIVPVITGYIGATRDGLTTTFGRGGGDYTAALIGAVLSAEEVCIWTDVDGILTADPKIVSEAHSLSELSYDEAAEMGSFGAEVLHPRTLVPVAEQGIALRIRSALDITRPGTRIVTTPRPSTHPARAIISVRGLSLLTMKLVQSEDWAPDWSSRALARLAGVGVDVLMFAHNGGERSITLTIRASDAPFVRDNLAATFGHEHNAGLVQDVVTIASVAMVAIINTPNGEALTPRVLRALGRSGTHILEMSQNISSRHVSFVLAEDELEHTVRILHDDLGLAR